MAKPISQHYVDTLADAGVRRIYAITGDSLNSINNAVRINGKIQWIHVRHEESGAFAAGAEAQLTGQLACCAGSSGPGHVHLINGLYDAHRSYAPVVVIASACASTEFGTQYFQETNTIKLFDDCSYYNEMPSTPQQAERQLQCAMQSAIEQEGVAVVGMPGDTAYLKVAPCMQSVNPKPSPKRPAPDMVQIKQLAAVLNKADKVAFYCGTGAAEAHKQMLQLAKLLNAPVGSTYKGKLFTQADCPNFVGLNGLMGSPACYDALHEADVVLILGADMPYNQFYPSKNYIVQIDKRGEHLGRRAHIKLGICADVALALDALIPLIEQKTDDSFLRSALKRWEDINKKYADLADHHGDKNTINPEFVMQTIDRLADDNAIFTADTGMNNVWSARYINQRPGGKRNLLISGNHGSMANAMPQAMGAALACPDRQVISLSGDGGITMLMGDLATIAQYKLPVKIVVFENCALGMVKLEMETAGLPDWQTNMVNPNFAKIAEACGYTAYDVTEPDQVEATLKEALAQPGPVLVCVHTNSNILAMPPKTTWAQAEGFLKAQIELLKLGRGEEVLDTIKSNADLI